MYGLLKELTQKYMQMMTKYGKMWLKSFKNHEKSKNKMRKNKNITMKKTWNKWRSGRNDGYKAKSEEINVQNIQMNNIFAYN